MMTIQSLRLLARDALKGIAELEREIFEADLLLNFATGYSRAEILAHPDATLPPEEIKNFLELLERRKKHEPIAYITGKKEFFGYEFKVTPDVLIPRPETELLVELVLSRVTPYCEAAEPFSVIDVGTGSGAIIVSVVKALSERFEEEVLRAAKFVGADKSEEALKIATENAARLGVIDWILFGPSDLLSVFKGRIGRFPRPIIFVANLPYIPLAEELPVDVQDYEPTLALRGGEDGLDLVRCCIQEWRELSLAEDRLLLEVGEGQASKLSSDTSAQVHSDLRGVERVVELTR